MQYAWSELFPKHAASTIEAKYNERLEYVQLSYINSTFNVCFELLDGNLYVQFGTCEILYYGKEKKTYVHGERKKKVLTS